MKRRILVLSLIPLVSVTVLFMFLVVSSASADGSYPKGYADDRAQIEDLLARYMHAVDYNDAEGLAALYAEDAVLIDRPGAAPIRGRAAILKSNIERNKRYTPKPDAKEKDKVWVVANRHFITNLVIKVDGDKAYGSAYYVRLSNPGDDRKGEVVAYGTYTDEYVKVKGRWYFNSRTWTNETRDTHTPAGKAFINPSPSPY